MDRLFVAGLAALLTIGVGGAFDGVGSGQTAPEKAGDSRTCLANGSIVSRVVEDERTLRFETLGGRRYRNRLPGPCPGLRQAANGFGALGTAPACPLGSFEHVADLPARRQGRH